MSLQVGDRVRITSGYGTGMTGVIQRFWEHTKRASVLMDEVPEDWPYHTLEFAPLVSQLEKI